MSNIKTTLERVFLNARTTHARANGHGNNKSHTEYSSSTIS